MNPDSNLIRNWSFNRLNSNKLLHRKSGSEVVKKAPLNPSEHQYFEKQFHRTTEVKTSQIFDQSKSFAMKTRNGSYKQHHRHSQPEIDHSMMKT